MSKLDELFGAEEPKDSKWKEVDIVIHCGKCYEEADEAYVTADYKHVRTVHYVDDDKHVIEAELDLTWLANLPS